MSVLSTNEGPESTQGSSLGGFARFQRPRETASELPCGQMEDVTRKGLELDAPLPSALIALQQPRHFLVTAVQPVDAQMRCRPAEPASTSGRRRSRRAQ